MPIFDNRYWNKGNCGRWISADLHVHSIYSGGSLTPLEILNSAGTAFLDAVAISDHNKVRGAIEGQIIAGTAPGLPLVLASQEVSVGDHCHFLLVGSTQACDDVNRYKIQEVLRLHHQRGGAVILAHPWTALKNGWFKGLFRDLVTESLVDGLELCNASILELSRDGAALLDAIWEEWLVPYNLAVTGGSDFHYREKGRMIGLGRTYLKVYDPGESGLLEALRNRRCVAGVLGGAEQRLPGDVVGNNILLGQEPWRSELNALIDVLRRRVAAKAHAGFRSARFLEQLISTGNFQPVADLLDSN